MKIIEIDAKASVRKAFTQSEVDKYNEMVFDSNPVHSDAEYCGKTIFEAPIVPGMLVASLFGGLLGSKLPGNGTILLANNISYVKPVHVGREIIAEIILVNKRADKPIFTFQGKCIWTDGTEAVRGEIVVYYKGEYFS